MDQQDYIKLYEKFLSGKCTPEEKRLLDNYFDEFDLLDIPWNKEIGDQQEVEDKIFNNIRQKVDSPYVLRRSKLKWIAVAASVLLFTFGSLYFLNHRDKKLTVATNKPINLKNDILPGGNKAILTLANGKQIVLTDAHNGTLALQHNTEIKKTADGKIVYTINSPGPSVNQNSGIQYNTITTPRGGQYTVVLPDGSKVSLNAASSLTYPAAFTGDERKVELTGEAYFEVTHNPVKPFKVSSNGQTVEVLGTHFNINAYSDERTVKTTLLEGAVKISKGSRIAVLKPGQQTQISNNELNPEININSNADIEEAVAWKNGLFMFDGDNIQHIMRMVSRWYDVDVQYNGAIQDDAFGGSVPRLENVSEVLKTLQLTGKVHFKIEGRKIIVSK